MGEAKYSCLGSKTDSNVFFFFGDSGKGHANTVFRPSRFFDPRH